MTLNIKRNSVLACLEVAFTGIALFSIYKCVVFFLGIRSVGIWSLVLATTSLLRLVDLGASSSLSRFVAMASGRGDKSLIDNYIDTSIFSNLMLYVPLAAASYWPLSILLRKASPDEYVAVALQLFPYAISSVILVSIATSVLSAIVGLQRSDLKSVIVICGLVIQIIFAVTLLPSFGIISLALAQLAQGASLIVMGAVVLCRLRSKRIGFYLPRYFESRLFFEMMGFGIKLQIANVAALVFEPVTKFVMVGVAGLETLGVFEMAYRLTLQLRSVILAPVQTLIPAMAHLNEMQQGGAKSLYERALVFVTILGIPPLLSLMAAAPLVGRIWLGEYSIDFVQFTAVFCAAWIVNIVSAPSYFYATSTGYLNANILGHIITGAGTFVFGIAAGGIWGSYGVVTAAGCALSLGIGVSMLLNCSKLKIPLFPSRAAFRAAFSDYWKKS